MKTDEIAISVQAVSKTFNLPHERQGSIKNVFVNVFRGRTTYEKQKVLNNISFEIKKGEFLGVVGRNGSGKSTLLKLLSGIYSPDKGHIQINGKLIPFIELGVGFNPELTGRENVFLNGALLGFDRRQMEAMYEEIVQFAELEKFMDQKLKNYSSGMQVRLAFSIAIRANTDILVLDEVLAVGDEDFQRKCHEYFKKLHTNKKTVILVTHNMNAVREYCDRAILIDQGKIVVDKTDVDYVADEYSKMFLELKDTKESNRFGTGEIMFRNITHSYNKDNLLIKFDLENMTEESKNGVEFTLNVYSDGQLVTGNGTKYVSDYKQGITLGPKSIAHFEVDMPNYFGNYKFEVNMNVRGDNGRIVYDEIKPAFHFQSNNTHMTQFLRIKIPLIIRKG